jgi:chromosome segregation protein
LYITELEIDNFKSFAKKTKIPFFEGFTVISGPNGSGKSNIIDSILFVLGLSGSRSLRAEKLTDLINLKSGKNIAEVVITFSDGTKVRRRIKRTGNGYYSYHYLNDRVCKLSDITDLLAKVGIKPHGYNVVMQGDITRIMEMSDFDRRKIMDEIAGVAEFDQKKQQALGELEIVRERVEREELLLVELNRRLSELKREREQALEYEKWQKQLDYFQSCRSAAQLNDRRKELGTLQNVIEEQNTALGRIASDRGLEENDLNYLRTDLREIDEQINEKSGSEYLKLITDLEEAKSGIRVAEQAIVRLRKEKEGNLEAINRIFMDAKRAEGMLAQCTDSIRAFTIDRANLAMEAATAKAQLEKIETEIRKQSEDTAGSRETLFRLMGEVEEKKGARSAILQQRDLLIERSRMRTSEIERLTERVRQLESEYAGKQVQLADSGKAIEELEKEKADLDLTLSGLESSVFAQRSMLERVRTELRDYEQQAVRLEAHQQARGEAGGKALEAVLGMDGVHGTVGDLGKAPAEYATALGVAAAGKLQFAITDDDEVASDAIQYLKDGKLGRVTFLPLNKLKPAELPPLKGEGIIDYAVNLLEFDPKYDKAFRVVLGRTVVVDTLARARKMMGRFRMVTLEGELVEKSGAMTGGALRKGARGFGVAVDDELTRIRLRISELSDDAAGLEAAVRRTTAEGDAKRAGRQEIDQKAARYRIVIEELGKRIEALSAEKQSVETALAQLGEEARGTGSELAQLESSLDGTTDAIAALGKEIDVIKRRLEGTDIPALTEALEKKKKESEETDRRLRNKESDISDAQRERAHFTKRVEELNGDRQRAAEKNAQIDAEITANEQQITASKEKIKKLDEQQKQFSGELDDLRKKRGDAVTQIQASEQKLVQFDSAQERARIQLSAMQERERTLIGELELLRQQVGETETTLSLTEIEAGIAEADRSIRRIGAVNMLAIQEYEKVESQASERTEKKEILSRERTTIIERIEKYEQMKYESFMNAFHAIDGNFREIFARLTSGSGHLILENEENPFAGGLTFAVQPRDKTVHLLSSLSGGEKSLTTLAFIFSVQKYIPAPFYALDEVDMSLDGSNVDRIAAMIKELENTSQFIIISLRKPMIEQANRIVGVTLRPDKSTLVTGVKVNE